MKNPSLCCKVTFYLRVTLLKSGLACHRQAKPKRNIHNNERKRSCFESCANKGMSVSELRFVRNSRRANSELRFRSLGMADIKVHVYVFCVGHQIRSRA
jgi:hypothetical protein